MNAEVFNKATGESSSVPLESIDLNNPSVVRLQMNRADVAGLERQGDDLIIRLQSGETIRIVDFYVAGPDGVASDLVLQEPDGSMWLARPGSGTQFYELTDWGELVPGAALATDAGGAGAGILLPALGLLGAGGLVAAVAGGGGGSDDGIDPPAPPPPDVTPPAAPTADVDDATGTTVTGTGEAGATVTVYAPDGTTVLGTGTVQPDGTYSVTIPAQTNGEELTVTLTDAAGNVSPPTSATAPDLTAPDAPTAEVDDATGATVTGTGEAGATVTVYGPDGTTVLGTGTVQPDGTYSVTITPAQTNGEEVTVTQTDPSGNESAPISATAPDLTAPDAPTADVDDATGTTVTGTGEAGATVTVYAPDGTTVLGTGTVQPDGSFSVTITPAQTGGEALTVTQTDAAGNESGPTTTLAPDFSDVTAPAAPTADVDDATGATVTGTGEAGATVTVYAPDGTTVLGTGTVQPDGSYSVTIPAQTNGEELTVTQTDPSGNESAPTTAIAPDLTVPDAPTADVDDATGATVTGTGEAGATVTVYAPDGTTVLGTGTVQPDGSYSVTITPAQTGGEALTVTQTDAAGNESDPTTTLAPDFSDVTAPDAPTADVDDATGATVTGTGEAGATVTVYAPDGTTVLGTGTVQPDGSYSVTIPAQTNGEELTVTQTDPSGNESAPTSATAPDLTVPDAPTADVDDATGTTVTGMGEAGATVTVYAPDGTTVLGTGTVQPDGSYSVTIAPAQTGGEALTVTQTDAAGNESDPTTTLAPDLSDVTAPAAPTADVDDATGATVTGTGEAGATVTVYAPDGTTVLGTGTVQPDGSYSVTITPAQIDSEELTVTQTDPSGNESAPTTATAPDLTVPDAPTADVDDATGTTVTGTGEAGATVTIYAPDGTTELGTGTVQPDGTYSVTITPAQTNGEALTVTQTDAAGNESAGTSVTAPDLFDAFDNLDSASLDLVPVTADVDVGSANYLLLVSLATVDLQLDLAGLQLLGIEPVSFTVDPGHELDATFEYGGLLDIGLVADYQVVIQKFVDGQWVGVDGDGEATLLDLGLLNGDLVGSQNLDAGEYRAFVTFDGLLGAGILGTLDVSGVDSDFTQIADIIAITADGNVITDANGTGEIDLAPVGTVVSSVTVDGVTTDVTADGTVVAGEFGTLVIDLDGSYVYTPTEDGANIGATETFVYTLESPGGAQESASLVIEIGSPDVTAAPVATDDAATAAVLYENVVTEVSTPLFTLNNGIIGTESDIATFAVAADTESDATVNIGVSSLITLFPSYTVTLTNTDTGIVVDTQNVTAIADLLGLTSASVTFADLPPGNYSIEVSSTGIGTGYTSTVVLDEDVTDLTQFQVDAVSSADGNLLDNDVTGSLFTSILVDSGTGFQEIGNTPVTLAGTYGSLTIDAAGNYHYEPDSGLAYFATDQVETFSYQIQHPNGEVVQAELTITVDVIDPGGALPAAMASVMSFETGDVIALDSLGGETIAGTTSPTDLGALAFDLFEGSGDLVDILTSYLGESKAIADGSGGSASGGDIAGIDPSTVTVADPLAFISILQDDELSANNQILI
jgi:VCBS repeat-containing protein